MPVLRYIYLTTYMSPTPGNVEGKQKGHSQPQQHSNLKMFNPSAFTGSLFKHAFLIDPRNHFSLYKFFSKPGAYL